MIHDSRERYGTVTKLLHWLTAVLICWQLLKLSDRIAEGEHWIGLTLVPWHVSVGTVLLVLGVARVLWIASQRRQPEQNPATAFLVKAGHGALYACMVLMPLSGVMVMLGGGYGLTAFGVEIFARGDAIGWAATLGKLHSPLAWLFTLLIAGHIGMALLHHFIHRDDTLKRML